MSPKRINTDSLFYDEDRCWPYGVDISPRNPRDYLPVEHVAPHELGANCRVVPMAVLVEWAARFDKLATRDAAEGAGEPDWAVAAQEAKASSQRVLDDARVDLASTRIPMMSATPKLAPDAMEALTKADTFAAALPVQPGAGGDIRVDKAYAEGVRACLRRLEHLRKSTDDKAWKDCEAMWRNRIAEIEASRQPPQSSSDTK